MRSVIVPLDGSELASRALESAALAAARAGSAVRLVMRPDPGGEAEAGAHLGAAAARLGHLEVTTEIVRGAPARAIVAAAARRPEPVVWMSTHGRGALGAALVGSIAEQVVARATMPVVLVGPEVRADRPMAVGDEILLCSDGSPESAAAVPVVVDLARALGLRVVVTEVVGPEEEVAGPGETVVDEVGRAAADRCAALAGVLTAAGVDDVQVEVGHGADAAASIAHRARRHPVALVAMATHGRTGLRRVVMGSVALRTVHLSPCPVVVVRSGPAA